ncbi:MAG: hypothetical protein P9L92_11645 [Candidatus Electryonea clarkiae]|nr:hypothetical protein [Candidatus Electryonea clarkiae]MDP8286576.1 hypothetical protein [Candidatus Electryonea clarkiae]
MSRPVRIHIPGALYLIQIRARPEVQLFSSEDDRELFLQSMGDTAVPAGVKVYAFALLEQSALLFVRAGTIPLSKFVHRMQAGYFNRIRAIKNHSQPVLRDRHREILVEEDPFFLPVLQRVHLAPIIGEHWSNESEARKWGEIATTRWTSLPVINETIESPPGFDRDEIIKRFSSFDSEKPIEVFYRYLIKGTRGTEVDILDHVVAMSLLGRQEFVEKYFETAKGRRKLKIPEPDLLDTPGFGVIGINRFDLIVKTVAKEYKIKPHELKKARSRHPGRKFVVELAMRYALDEGGVKGIGEKLGVTGSALAHMRKSLQQRISFDPALEELFQRIEKNVLDIIS